MAPGDKTARAGASGAAGIRDACARVMRVDAQGGWAVREQGGGRKEEKGEGGRKEKKKRERKRKRREREKRERAAVGGIRGDVDHARRLGDTQRNTWDEKKKEKGL